MHLLFLLTQSLESPGGGGRYLPLAKALAAQGHRVTLLALHHDWAALPQRAFVVDGVAVRYVGQMHVRKVGSEKFYFPPWQLPWIALRGTWALARAALAARADALHVCKTQPMNGLAAWLVHRLRGTPVYLDSDDFETLNNRFQAAWQQQVVAAFERWLPSFAAGISVHTTFLADHYTRLAYPPERLFLVPHGVEQARFDPLDAPTAAARLAALREQWGLGKGVRPLVYVGSMSTVNHALDHLLLAFARVAQVEGQARLLMVGGGEELESLHTEARRLGLEGRVCFVGHVPLADVPFFYRLGEFSVAPMRDDERARSSLSLKLFESIAAGVPVLTSDVGDFAQAVGAAGVAVAPNEQALADGILQLLGNPARLGALQAAAQAQRHQVTWAQRVQQFVRLYERSDS